MVGCLMTMFQIIEKHDGSNITPDDQESNIWSQLDTAETILTYIIASLVICTEGIIFLIQERNRKLTQNILEPFIQQYSMVQEGINTLDQDFPPLENHQNEPILPDIPASKIPNLYISWDLSNTLFTNDNLSHVDAAQRDTDQDQQCKNLPPIVQETTEQSNETWNNSIKQFNPT